MALDQGLSDDMSQSPNKGGTVAFGDVRITLTDANHSSSTFANGTFAYLGEPCGVVLRPDDGPTIYIAGDTNVFGDMALIRRIYAPDVAVLPIGDHFTMGPRRRRSRPSSSARLASSPRTTAPSRSSRGRRTRCARCSPTGWSCSHPRPARRSSCEIALVRRDRATRARDRARRHDRRRRGARPRLGRATSRARGRTRGTPVVVRASDAAAVKAALARPEVSCVLVDDPGLLELDLPELTYG